MTYARDGVLRDGASIVIRGVWASDGARESRAVGAIVELVPELVELDLNPMIVLAPGDGAIAVDARLRLTDDGRARPRS
jgi:hypothetical protein